MQFFSQNKPVSSAPGVGALIIITAAALFAVHIWIIKTAKDFLDAWQVGYGRWMVGIIMVLILSGSGGFRRLWRGNKRLLIIRGLVGTCSYLCMVYANLLIPISQATVLFFVCPMFAAVMSIWMNKQPVRPIDWLFIAGGFFGVVFVLDPGEQAFHLQTGHLVALAASFFAGMAMSLMRALASDNHPYTVYFWFCLIGAPIVMGPAIHSTAVFWPGWWAIGALLAAAVLGSLGQLMINQGFKYVPAHVGAVLLSSQVVFTAVLGVFFLNEPFTWSLVVGTALILGCGAALSQKKKPKSHSTVSEAERAA